MILQKKPFAESRLALGITSAATSLTLLTGDGIFFSSANTYLGIWPSRFQTPGHAFRAGYFEWVLVSTRSGDIVQISTRGARGTVALNHNVQGEYYYVSELLTPEDLYDIKLTDLTHTQLTALINSNSLIAGASYRINDYQTVHTINGSVDISTGLLEPLIVTAVSSNLLGAVAKSELYPKDIIYYDVENNQSKVPGCTKGYIYRRIDTVYGNDISFDYRNVKFRRYQIDIPAVDATGAVSNYVTGNIIKKTGTNQLYIKLNNNTAKTFSDTNAWKLYEWNNLDYVSPTQGSWLVIDNSFSFEITCSQLYKDYTMFSTQPTANGVPITDFSNIYNNVFLGDHTLGDIIMGAATVFFGDTIHDNHVNGTFYNNTIGNAFYFNKIEMMLYTTIGQNFSFNKTSYGFTNNSIANDFSGNIIDYNFSNNIITSAFGSNKTQGIFSDNTIASPFVNNTIRSNFDNNIIGMSFSQNNIYDSFTTNVVSSNFQYNTIKSSFSGNDIATNFTNNIINNTFSSNAIGDTFTYNTTNGEFSGNEIGSQFVHNVLNFDFGSCTVEDSFQVNNIDTQITGVDFSGATYCYLYYTKNWFRTPSGIQRISYYANGTFALTFVAITA